jgi:type I restriction enzyme S subunit
MNDTASFVGRLSPTGVSRQFAPAGAERGVGLRFANPTYTASLDIVCSIIADCPHSTPFWTDSGFLVIRNQNIKNGNLDLSERSYTDHKHYLIRIRRAKPQFGDLIFTREAPMGDVCMVPEGLECCVGQRQVLLRPNPEIVVPRYLLYAIQSPEVQHEISWSEGTGSTVSNVRIPVLKKIKIPLLPLKEQAGVATLLGALDDRITLLRETNATLEAIAQALFKSWFVDFDPVHAKQQGIAPEGMDDATAALFPDSFEESELGLVPRGWRVRAIDETCVLGRGSSPRPIQKFMGGDVPWIKIADATASDGMFVFETKEMIIQDGVRNSVKVSPGDLIMSNSASCGITVFVELHGCIHDGWLYFKNYQHISKNFLFFWLRKIADHLVHIADGSVQKNLNIALVSKQRIVCPSAESLQAFERVAGPTLSRVRENCIQAQTLASLRDTLLPRLISGKLRLPEVEAQL